MYNNPLLANASALTLLLRPYPGIEAKEFAETLLIVLDVGL
jgi:hypothetical protein